MVLRTLVDSETSQYHSQGAQDPRTFFFWGSGPSRFSASLEETLHKDGVETSGASLWPHFAVGHLQVTCRSPAGLLQVITGLLQVITGHHRSLHAITGHDRSLQVSNMQWQYAMAICNGNRQWQYAMAICNGNLQRQ